MTSKQLIRKKLGTIIVLVSLLFAEVPCVPLQVKAASIPEVDSDVYYANGTALFIEAGKESDKTAIYYMNGEQKVYLNESGAAGDDLRNCNVTAGGRFPNDISDNVTITMTGGNISNLYATYLRMSYGTTTVVITGGNVNGTIIRGQSPGSKVACAYLYSEVNVTQNANYPIDNYMIKRNKAWAMGGTPQVPQSVTMTIEADETFIIPEETVLTNCGTIVNNGGKVKINGTLTNQGIIKCNTHSYDDACDTDCNLCGEKRMAPHQWKTATCEAPKTCENCNLTEGSKLEHSYVYEASEGIITETCENGCTHRETATLALDTDVSMEYTGLEIRPFTVRYSDNWKGGNLDISYTNNINASSEISQANGSITKNNQTATKSFIINHRKMTGISASGFSGTYDGEQHKIAVMTNLEGAKITYSTAEDGNYIDVNPAYINAGIYTVWYKVEKENYASFIGNATVKIVPAELTIKAADASKIYGEDDPKFTWSIIKGALIGKDKLEKISISREKGEAADNYDITVKQEAGANDNYNIIFEPGTFTIKKANQKAPDNLVGTPEEIDGKANGKITGVDSSMEYRKDDEIQYTAIEDRENEDSVTELTDLADGIYYIRYKETANYNASPDAEVALHNDKKLAVSLPEVQEGYVLTVDKDELAWMGKATLTFALQDGYSLLENFAVKKNDEKIIIDEDGTYTMENVQEDVSVTVEGVADITPPTATIILGTNRWNQFFHKITFGLFFKETQKVTIDAQDVNTGSGLDKVCYYLADSELTKEDVMQLADEKWTEYKDAFFIKPQEEYIIYAKVIDKAGNVVYLSSEQGIIVDTIAPVVDGITNGRTYYGDTSFRVTEEYADIVTVDGNRVTLTDGAYIIQADDKEHIVYVTDKAGNNSGEIKITVCRAAPEGNTGNADDTGNVDSTGKPGEDIDTGNNNSTGNNSNSRNNEWKNIFKVKAKVTLSGKKLTVTWGKATKADGYDIFLRRCDGKSFSKKPTKTIKKNSVTSYTFKKFGGKKMNATKNYKVKVKAYQYKNGKKVYIAATDTLHVAGKESKKYTNVKKVTVNKTKVTVKVGKTVKIMAKVIKANSKKKLLEHGGTIRYYSTKTKVATVDKTGHIKAVAKGKAKIYVMAENGKKATVTVTVK